MWEKLRKRRKELKRREDTNVAYDEAENSIDYVVNTYNI